LPCSPPICLFSYKFTRRCLERKTIILKVRQIDLMASHLGCLLVAEITVEATGPNRQKTASWCFVNC